MNKQQGMTLLELLIATVILAIMAGMGLFGIQSLISAEQRVTERQALWRSESMSLIQLTQDVQYAVTARGNDAGQNNVFTGTAQDFQLVRFRQSMVPGLSQVNKALSDVVQVSWYWRNGQLYRAQRPWLQNQDAQAWIEQPMGAVRQWRCEYQSLTGDWVPRWPQNDSSSQSLPKQLKCQVTMSGNRVSEWVLVPWQQI